MNYLDLNDQEFLEYINNGNNYGETTQGQLCPRDFEQVVLQPSARGRRTSLNSPLDYISHPGGKKYSMSSHNTQPRGYVCYYSQLPAGCAQLQLCGGVERERRNIVEEDEGGDPPLEIEEPVPTGFTRATFRSLTGVQRIALKRNRIMLIVGASSPISSNELRRDGILDDDNTYTPFFESTLADRITSLLVPNMDITPEQMIGINWTTTCRLLMGRETQVFNTLALSNGTPLASYGPVFAALFDPPPASRTAIRQIVYDHIRAVGFSTKRWDFYADEQAEPAREEEPRNPRVDRLEARCHYFPVQEVCVTQNPTKYESEHGRPDSGLLAVMRLRLQDQSANSALGNIIRGPTIRDGTSVLSLSKMTSDDAGTVMDVTPLLRLYCMITSMDKRLYTSDPSPSKYVTGTKFHFEGLTYERPPEQPFYLVCMTLSVYTAWMSGAVPSEVITLEDRQLYTPSGVDLEWIAIPIRTAFLGNRGVIPYIMCHMDSYLWSGRVNCEYSGNNFGTSNFMPHVMTMPVSNSVAITGRRRAIIVLMDETGPSSGTIDISGINVPVWSFENRPRNRMPGPPVNAFSNFCSSLSSQNFISVATWAEKELVKQSSVYGSASIARSLASILYSAWRPGYNLDPNRNIGTLNGAYHPGISTGRPQIIPYPSTDFKQRNIMSMTLEFLPMWMDTINFFSLNPAHLAPSAYALSSDELHNATRWHQVAASSPQFFAPQSSSNTRLAVHMGLYQRTNDEILHFSPHALGSWLHMQAAALSAATAHTLVESDIMASIWCGTFSGYDTLHKSSTIDAIKDSIFGGLIRLEGPCLNAYK